MLHGPPIPSSSTWLFHLYLAKSTNHVVPCYAIFFIHPSSHPSSVQISSSAPCSQTPSVYLIPLYCILLRIYHYWYINLSIVPSVYVPPLMSETKFHTHTDLKVLDIEINRPYFKCIRWLIDTFSQSTSSGNQSISAWLKCKDYSAIFQRHNQLLALDHCIVCQLMLLATQTESCANMHIGSLGVWDL
jgi:hypothetical protein